MTRKNRIRKSWQRNYDLWMCKGVYVCDGPMKYWPTPKQVIKEYFSRISFKKEKLQYGFRGKFKIIKLRNI